MMQKILAAQPDNLAALLELAELPRNAVTPHAEVGAGADQRAIVRSGRPKCSSSLQPCRRRQRVRMRMRPPREPLSCATC